jgi:predicted AlkP superfamily pyrophosphatase or phosphodiesterase
MKKIMVFLGILILVIQQSCIKPEFHINHVIVVGIDGMGGNAIINAETPYIDSLIKYGSYTLNARAVLPTSSSPNWASMIMGAGPEQHGITSNNWEKSDHKLPPVEIGPGGIFPTVFSVIKSGDQNTINGAIYQWKDFGRLFEKEFVDYDTSAFSEIRTTELACDFIRKQKPTFCFIHIDHVDGAGHKWGYDSERYYEGVERADLLIGKIKKAVIEAGISDKTIIIISADHGGLGKGHGGEPMNEVEIPVILTGPVIKQGYKIKSQVNIYDIASTVVYALDLKQPEAWIGKPIEEVFLKD